MRKRINHCLMNASSLGKTILSRSGIHEEISSKRRGVSGDEKNNAAQSAGAKVQPLSSSFSVSLTESLGHKRRIQCTMSRLHTCQANLRPVLGEPAYSHAQLRNKGKIYSRKGRAQFPDLSLPTLSALNEQAAQWKP